MLSAFLVLLGGKQVPELCDALLLNLRGAGVPDVFVVEREEEERG